jgi:phosphatidylserine/phosphatidylglycerophosphate/cardiolipin synthase-like enzyme
MPPAKKRRRRTPNLTLTLVLLLLLAAVGVYAILSGKDLPGFSRSPAWTPQASPTVFSGDPVQVLFTNPQGPEAETLRGGPDAALAEAIRQARVSVDVAAYQLNLWSLRDALIAASGSGVTVRIVTDSDYLDEAEVQELIAAGIPVLGDRRESLMHNKFVIIDRLGVWTGSMNLTIAGAYSNDNNLIYLRSTRLAENYLAEFEEMFMDDQFGPGSPADTPNLALRIEGLRVENYFSPEDGTAARLVQLLQGANKSIHFLAYSFTSDEMAAALIERAGAGVQVSGVFEEGQYLSNQGTEFDRLRAAGLDVRLDGNPDNMHHKVIIIDQAIVVTGSYNFSANAEERNDENTLILYDPLVAAQYEAEFARVLALAQRK